MKRQQNLELDFVAVGKDQPVAWLWEVLYALPYSIPLMSNEKNAIFNFEQPPFGKRPFEIILTAYTENGCRVMVREIIEFTEYKTPIIINVIDFLGNVDGLESTLTEAKLDDSSQGEVVINANQAITYTPDETVENRDVVISYTVEQVYGRKIQSTVTVYVGKKPCDLPCKGIAVRRGYRFLLPPSPKLNIQLKFAFKFPQGSSIDLSRDVQNILQKVAGDNDSFAEQINSLIAEKTGRSDWLKFEHSPSESSFMDTWWIEYFECLQFELEVYWSIREIIRVPNIYTITVTPTASTYVVKNMEETYLDVTIPAFDGVKIDKCNPQTPVKPLCAQELDLALKISPPQVDGLTANVNVTPSGSDKPVAYLWEVQDGNPPISNGQQASFTFTQLEPATKLIRLTAFTEKGCSVMVKDIIDIKPQ